MDVHCHASESIFAISPVEAGIGSDLPTDGSKVIVTF